MSLFKSRELWTTRCGGNSYEANDDDSVGVYEQSSILIADLRGEGADQITVGGHDGVLRIFSPFTDDKGANESGFSPTDLLIEIDLGQPILQILAGRFVSGSKTISLGILHPRSVGVYNFVTISGSTEHGNQSQVFMVYEHHLKRSAFNMVSGGFGGVDGRDFLCVQGLDGTLMFYEQETLILTRPLPGYLIPSPLVYVPHTDSFILVNSNWYLQSFRYQILGEESGEKPIPSWQFNLGEAVNDIKYLGVTTTEAAIFLSTDRNIYCFNETGLLKFCKRLQYNPVCFTIYSKGEPTVMSLVATDTKALMVYEQTTLKWSSQLPFMPVAIERASFVGIVGCIVLLSEQGDLACSILGTEPTLFVPPPLQETATTMSEVESKLSTLQHQIATYSQDAKSSVGAPKNRPDVKLMPKVWPLLDGHSSCQVEITVEAMTPVHNFRLNVIVEDPFMATPNTHYIQNLGEKTEVTSSVSVKSCHTVPWTLDVLLMAVYLCSDHTAGTVQATITLPLNMVLELTEPAKESEASLSLVSSQSIILPTIFPDSWNETASNEYLAGFRFKHSPEVTFTIMLNKTQHKYRLDTNFISALTLPVTVMSKKLENKTLHTSQHALALTELLGAVDNNVELRNQIREFQDDLRRGASQMRAAQKRLLTKMRDKTPADLAPLSRLIELTHDYIFNAAYKLETAQRDLEENSTRLTSLVRLTTSLLMLTTSASKDEAKLFSQCLTNRAQYSENLGWAEISEAALNHVLRNNLARSLRDQYLPPVTDSILVTNSTNLKKYITMAIDRIVHSQRSNKEDRAVSPILESEEDGGGVTVSITLPPHQNEIHLARPTLYQDTDADVKRLLRQASVASQLDIDDNDT